MRGYVNMGMKTMIKIYIPLKLTFQWRKPTIKKKKKKHGQNFFSLFREYYLHSITVIIL